MRPEIKASLDRYGKDHVPTGGFLGAVLANDLTEAFLRAEPENLHDLHEIVLYVHWEIPGNCHGSYEIVKEWVKK